MKSLLFSSKAKIRLLITLSFLASGTSLLVGCSDDNVQAQYYQNAQECINAHRFTEKTCNQEWQKAVQVDHKSAPRYEDPNDCKEQTGEDCQAVSANGHVVYVPYMRGYIVGGETSSASKDLIVVSQPVYGVGGTHFTASGGHVDVGEAGRASLSRSAAVSHPDGIAGNTFGKGSVTRGFGGSFHASSGGHGGGSGE